ncbi:MAG: SIR2 family protein [Dechloromonas sp.]|nr:MAG: SIR2 family protein [Dechloromonas sp.]
MTKKTAPIAAAAPSPAPAAVAVSAKPVSSAGDAPTHCPYKQANLLQQALSPNKMRVGFLLGAGCPVSIRVDKAGGGTDPLIPDIANLTAIVRSKLEADPTHRAAFADISKRLKDSGKAAPNIEEILTHIRALVDIVAGSTIDGLAKDALSGLDDKICQITTEIVGAKLPGDGTPYHHLAAWIGGIQRAHPVEIFTPNYDLLAEQALEQCRVPYFDGFVGSCDTFFDVASIEQDKLPPRWSRLWKLHGSINWWRTSDGNVVRHSGASADGSKGRQMIYPSHLKYDQSRRLPYLAMLDRLKSFLANGQAVLITCGYSYADQHLNEVILQGLSGNPTAVCFGMLFGERTGYAEAVSRAKRHPNLSLLAADGAVLNTIDRNWRTGSKEEHPWHGVAVNVGDMSPRTKAPADQCKFLLGDFKAMGLFLAQHLAVSEDSADRA